ncbi:hypothetical protein DFH06DRAFT_1473270 [Mycena polygramma]|nr:hypothetical protein DFH06DRAFT_1473270 [Mycena polygramma]
MRLTGIISALVSVVLYARARPTHGLHPRTDASYQACLNKGTQILQQISASTSDAAGITDKYNKLYAPFAGKPVALPTTGGVGEEIMELLGAEEEQGPKQLLQISIARPNQETAYKNCFDIKNGVIAALENFNDQFFYNPNAATSNKQNPQKTTANSLQWNNLVAEQYKSLGGSLSTLSHILRYEIANAVTVDIIDTALGMSTLPKEDGWTVVTQGGAGDEMFRALLGTDNGQGAGYILKDYRASMPGKHIQAIRVKDDDGERAMIIDFA